MSKITYADKDYSRQDAAGYVSDADMNEIKTSVNVLYDDKVDKAAGERLINAAEITKVSNLSGTNTGDETASTIVTKIGDGSKISSTYLPSYVDDVVEVANYAALLGTGETGKIYVTLDDNASYRWSGSAYVSLSNPLSYASQAEAEANTENTKVMPALRVFQNWLANVINYTVSALNTTSKTIVGAINEIYDKATFSYPVTVTYNTAFPFNKGLTMMYHTLDANDTLTVNTTGALDGGGGWIEFTNDGVHEPVLNAFHILSGSYDKTKTYSSLVFARINGRYTVSITNYN